MGCVPTRPRMPGRDLGFREQYEIGPKIGSGAFAQVRQCVHRASGQQRVVKVIRKPYSAEDFLLEISLLQEAAGGKCENVVHFHEWLEDAHFYYSVMEYCSGGQLFAVMDELQTLTEYQLVDWTRQVLLAVDHVHALGIVHRDLKPQNILFLNETHKTLKLIDFGLSFKMAPRQMLDEPCGTPEFVAPEMVLGKYGRKVDIWAIGVMVYMMIFGYLPFIGRSEAELFRTIVENQPSFSTEGLPWVPSDLSIDFVRSLLRKNFKKRPTAAVALKHPWLAENDPKILQAVVIPLDIRRRARLASVALVKPDPSNTPLQRKIEEELKLAEHKTIDTPPSSKVKDFIRQQTHNLTTARRPVKSDYETKIGNGVNETSPQADNEFVRKRERKATRVNVIQWECRYAQLDKLRGSIELKDDETPLEYPQESYSSSSYNQQDDHKFILH